MDFADSSNLLLTAVQIGAIGMAVAVFCLTLLERLLVLMALVVARLDPIDPANETDPAADGEPIPTAVLHEIARSAIHAHRAGGGQ